jgi:hypothetical protein
MDTTAPKRKRWTRSRTLRFNAIVAGLAALEASSGLLQPVLPVNVYAVGLAVLTVGNAILRLVTTQGVGK